jgi:hypothetical protein
VQQDQTYSFLCNLVSCGLTELASDNVINHPRLLLVLKMGALYAAKASALPNVENLSF